MHKVVIAPDSFKGVLSAREVCDIISYKINRHYPFCQIVKVPVADGGEGSIEAFLCAKNGKKIFCDVKGANGETLNCYFGIFEKTAVVEVAQAVGLSLPTRAPALSGTTYGVGQLIGQAVKMGVEKILLCLGGTSTVDAGCGMAAALGAKFYDKEFREFLPVGKNLCEIRSVDFSAMRRLLGLVRINVLYDVDCKLCGDEGAAAVFGPQKGLTPSEISFADKNLAHFAEVVGQACGFRPEEIKGGGAAGGMGAGAKACFNADMNRGIDAVLETINFNSLIRDADLIITGEGRLDSQSVYGKALSGVCRAAKRMNVPVVDIVGEVGAVDREQLYRFGLTAVFALNNDISCGNAKEKSTLALSALTDEILNLWSIGNRADNARSFNKI